MSAPMKRKGPLDQEFWYGYLCAQNYEDVAERMRRMLDGRRFTFVSVHDGHPGLTEVRTSERLASPVRTWRKDDQVGVSCNDTRYAWGISTCAATEAEGRAALSGNGFDYVGLSFRNDYRGEQLIIEQFNGLGEPLQWFVVLEAQLDDEGGTP